jgi:RND family efflux transporter MFP subunit
MKRRITWYAAVLPLLAVVGCGQGKALPRRGTVERLPRLTVVQPVRGKLTRDTELAATVESLKRVELAARVPGIVADLRDDMDIGRQVRKDEVLLRLAVPELDAEKKQKEATLEQMRKQAVQAQEAEAVAQREVEEAQKEEKRYAADLAYQQLRHQRFRDLVRRGAQEVQLEEEARRQLEAADAALQAARAKIQTRQAKARAAAADLEVARRRIPVAEAEVQKLAEMIAFATVRAPFDGVITRRWVDPGATIKDPGATLLTLVDMHRVRVLIDIPQRDVSLINTTEQNPNPDKKGDPVTVRIPELVDVVPRGEFTGTITRMARSLDPVTRTMRAEVELNNDKGYLRPGMYGTASVRMEERYVLQVPKTALIRRPDGKVAVFIVADPAGDPVTGKLKAVEIELGIDNDRMAEVRGTTLTGGELVVKRGNGVLREDDRVIAVPSERQP